MISPPIIIPATFGTTEAEAFELPRADQNLFGRIIRNPQPADRPPKEIECTEMLCAVLLNTELLRDAILRWLGSSVSQQVAFDELDLRIETEQSVAGKRDDLRIEGRNPKTNVKSLLWSIEVKVGSGFHYSSALDTESADDLTHQIVNYDHWLARQDVENRAGFVLSLRNAVADMPTGLQAPWACLTWTQLGKTIEPLLVDDTLSGTEAFLARHLLGFIRNHLWEIAETTMDTNNRLDFDDLALLRAFNLIGNRTISRVDSLIDPVAAVMAAADIGGGRPIISGKVFQGHNRKVVYQSLVDPDNSKPPYLFAGLVTENGVHLTVSLEASPKYIHKQALNHMLLDRSIALQERNPAWHVISLDDKSWRDLELAASVEQLLVAEDQVVWVCDFVSKALDDLKVAGVIEGARRIALGAG